MLKSLRWRARSDSAPRIIPGPMLQAGTLIDRKYRIVRSLGAGGMSRVFEAENCLTRRNVALKKLHAVEGGEGENARLLHEAQAGARVRHPNLVDVLDVITHEGATLLVLELLRGRTLAQHLHRAKPTVLELLELLIPAMRGVHAAHRAGIVHRDIKPENIFLSEELEGVQPTPKVLDFGVARVDDTIGSATRSGHTVGTPRFMSPEQLRALPDIDARTDVYAFGVILYLTLAGRPPYLAEQIGELAFQMVTLTPPALAELRPDVPSALCEAVMRALEIDRARRIDSLATLSTQLLPFTLEPELRARCAAVRLDTRAFVRASSAEPEAPTPGPTRILPLLAVQRATPIRATGLTVREPRRFARWSLLALGSALALGLALLGLQRASSNERASNRAQATTSAATAREAEAAIAETTSEQESALRKPAAEELEPDAQDTTALDRDELPRALPTAPSRPRRTARESRGALRVEQHSANEALDGSHVAADGSSGTSEAESTETPARRTNLRLEHF